MSYVQDLINGKEICSFLWAKYQSIDNFIPTCFQKVIYHENAIPFQDANGLTYWIQSLIISGCFILNFAKLFAQQHRTSLWYTHHRNSQGIEFSIEWEAGKFEGWVQRGCLFKMGQFVVMPNFDITLISN